MELTFLNPLFLFGLAACALPILIHRLTRRKGILRKFSAVRLILRSQQVMARPHKLKHFLLLALRILSIAGLVLLAARPVLTRQGLLALKEGGTKVIILDNSLSMSYRDERGERYESARRAAKEFIREIRGNFSVIPTTPIRGKVSPESEDGQMGPEEALRKIDGIPLSLGRGDPVHAFNLAFGQLKGRKESGEIFVITDTARADWEGFNPGKLDAVPGEVDITFLRIGGPKRDANIAVREVQIKEGDAVAGASLRLEAVIRSFSDQPGSTTVQLFLSGVKVDQKRVEVRAGEEVPVSFMVSFDKPGWVDGEVRLSEDNLPLDNLFYFPIKVREKVKVLVVDGDPRTSLRASESYYLVSALSPGNTEGSPFHSKVILEEELAKVDLQVYDAVFLLNVARPQVSRLASFMESGKTMVVFLGDRIDPEVYNTFPLLTWKLRDVRNSNQINPVRITEVDRNYESLKSLTESGEKGLKSASFHRYFKIDGNTRNLLTLGNNDPLLVEAGLGKGKLFLFTSSADLDWNDLPLKTAYLPLIQGLLKEALGLSRDVLPKGIRLTEPWLTEPFPEKTKPFQVLVPKGAPPGGPGIYQFSLPAGEMRRGVNTHLEESDLSKMNDEELKKKFGTMNVKTVDYKEGALSAARGTRKEIWPFILAFLLGILAIEMVIANRI